MTWLERLDECDRLIAAKDWDGLHTWVTRCKHLAVEWVTCACGQQDKRIQRMENNAPEDDRLYSLGVLFWQDWLALRDERSTADARATLAAIEKRATEILAEVT